PNQQNRTFPAENQADAKARLGKPRPADRVGVGSEPDRLGAGVVEHVPHRHSAAFRDRRLADDLLGCRVETYEPVGLGAGLDDPETILVVDRHGIWQRAPPGGKGPLGECPGGWIEAPEHPPDVIAIRRGRDFSFGSVRSVSLNVSGSTVASLLLPNSTNHVRFLPSTAMP